MKVLVVDDEPVVLETVETKLRKEGFTSFIADSAEEGMRLFRMVKPDLILLDVMLPGRSGFEFCQTIRKTSKTPVIFLTARSSEDDRVQGLELGGDDYVIKPFSLAELVARIRSVLRRSGGDGAGEVVEAAHIKLDPRTHEAWIRGSLTSLSPKEFGLLYFLVRNNGHVFSRDTLLDRVWGPDSMVSPRTVDVHVRWLRELIETDPSTPVHLITIRGIGYKFVG
ncbi:MAG: response regulator transcription factor [Fimbriimonadaceae bacterium]|nr:response regulator transcription factor [Fimbriimonadaceae bacterium]QYK57920.1 MAG: response regulator transcription factor [Fimbriimonadaceae bacterium]